MVYLKKFLPRLMPYCVGCTEPLALQALQDSAIDFCVRSNVLSVELDPITVVATIADYELEAPNAQTTVSTVLKVWYDGKIIEPIPYDDATGMYEVQPGTPRNYFGQYKDEAFVFTLMPTPDKTKANALRVRVSVRPTRDATQVDNILFDRYVDAIVAGAIGIICAVPDQPFTDTARALANTAHARAVANRARSDTMHGNVQTALSVTMRGF